MTGAHPFLLEQRVTASFPFDKSDPATVAEGLRLARAQGALQRYMASALECESVRATECIPDIGFTDVSPGTATAIVYARRFLVSRNPTPLKRLIDRALSGHDAENLLDHLRFFAEWNPDTVIDPVLVRKFPDFWIAMRTRFNENPFDRGMTMTYGKLLEHARPALLDFSLYLRVKSFLDRFDAKTDGESTYGWEIKDIGGVVGVMDTI